MGGIIQETWLTRFVDNYGEKALTIVTQTVYQSGLFKSLMLGSACLSLFSFAWNLHQRQFSQRAFHFLIAFCLLSPISGKPFGYILVSSISSTLSGLLAEAVERVVSGEEPGGRKKNLPPGAVMEMLLRAALPEEKSSEARELLERFMRNCFANTLKNNGEEASFDDLFNFTPTLRTVKEKNRPKIKLETLADGLDAGSLKRDLSFPSGDGSRKLSCYEGLRQVREAFSKDAGKLPERLTERSLGKGKDGEEKTDEAWFKDWKARDSSFKQLAMNLKIAHRIAHEKSRLIGDQGWEAIDPGGDWYSGSHMDAGLRELMITVGSTTADYGYRAADGKNMISNISRNRWAFSLGASVKDLKERIELMPYYTALIRLILKLVCPLFLMTVLLLNFRFLFLWSGAWVAATLFPAIVSACRAVHNSILMSKLGIESFMAGSNHHASSYGVHLKAAEELTRDFIPLAYSMVEQEIKIISVLSGCILAGSWIAGGGANSFVSWVSNAAQGALLSSSMAQLRTATMSKSSPSLASREGGGRGGGASLPGTVAHNAWQGLHQTTGSPSPQVIRGNLL